jgi:hypothetical protein
VDAARERCPTLSPGDEKSVAVQLITDAGPPVLDGGTMSPGVYHLVEDKVFPVSGEPSKPIRYRRGVAKVSAGEITIQLDPVDEGAGIATGTARLALFSESKGAPPTSLLVWPRCITSPGGDDVWFPPETRLPPESAWLIPFAATPDSITFLVRRRTPYGQKPTGQVDELATFAR